MAKEILNQGAVFHFANPQDPEHDITRRVGNVDPDASEERLFQFGDALAMLRNDSPLKGITLSTTTAVSR
ncbi:hypothetical protein [Lacticaseibacillus nasuensis]|nr:hypothetical protein [Lacticaseibacillus nasuensis]MCX2455080.1 hypothetical protein [Lacticaseibacillus nasuensis]